MRFKIADNSYAIWAENISNSRKKYMVNIGDLLILTVKKSRYGKFKKKKEAIVRGVVIRTKKRINRHGSYINFQDNAVVLVNNFHDLEPIGTKIFGMVGIEILQQYSKFENIIKIINNKNFK